MTGEKAKGERNVGNNERGGKTVKKMSGEKRKEENEREDWHGSGIREQGWVGGREKKSLIVCVVCRSNKSCGWSFAE